MTVVVQKRVSFVDNISINAFHSELYHGMATRDGLRYPKFRDYYLSDKDCAVGLAIVRSSALCPQITVPSLNWVIDGEVKQKMDSFGNIRFLVCQSVGTYELHESDLRTFTSDYSHPAEPSELHDEAVRTFGLVQSSKKLWEVIVGRGTDISHAKGDAILRWTVREDDEPVELRTMRDLLQEFQFVVHEGAYVLSDNLFDELIEYFPLDYYYIDRIA